MHTHLEGYVAGDRAGVEGSPHNSDRSRGSRVAGEQGSLEGPGRGVVDCRDDDAVRKEGGVVDRPRHQAGGSPTQAVENLE